MEYGTPNRSYVGEEATANTVFFQTELPDNGAQSEARKYML
jgi:hypothetical protein